MKNYTVRKYQPEDYSKWNAFIGNAKNATFLFHRDFMEYHKDRFEDYSLIVLDGENWVAVLPANVVGNEIFSHQGLTYGGLIYTNKLKQFSVISALKTTLSFLEKNQISKLTIKCVPSIYADFPADELLYSLFLSEAKLVRRDSLSVIDLQKGFHISKGRMEGVVKGIKSDLKVIEKTDFEDFWNEILIPSLERKHNAKPVHSLEEIKFLHSKFPKNIRQFNVYKEDKIVAGTTIFESKNVVHSQYISANEDKNGIGSLDFLHHYLITEIFKEKTFFDFGISNENQGKKLNNGLSFWKESFGARTIIQDFYEVETKNFIKLENILI
ncbi:GNAT family N-acetyltransferase [Flavobacterium qiangtangense]|uniref:GNAT family N-acetyltransferase n=1 Tax=Flavobacterium qiangtangense TaxID=1442595 RepID=A0ABW1PRQ1_9FLAO